MENDKQLIREFLESMSNLIDNVSNLARSKGIFVDEIDELRDSLEYTKEQVKFDIHNSSQYLPDSHFYFEKNEIKNLKSHLFICPNYLWTYNKLQRSWIKCNRVFARKCDITGVGMNTGFCIQDGLMYIKNLDDLNNHIKNDTDYKTTSDAYNNDYYYYTEWDDPLDYQYKLDENNKLVEL